MKQVTEATPPTRDRFIDVVRLFSLIVVITGHGIMLLVIIEPGGWRLGNVLSGSPDLQALTWLLQVMPLFFFAGTAASMRSYKGTDAAGWLFRRVQRLYRPVFYYVAVWALVLVVVRVAADESTYRNIAGVGIQLTWFLGMYLMVLLGVPLMHKIRTPRALWVSVAAVIAGVAAVDAVRLGDGPSMLGYLNYLAWYVAGLLGVGYARGLIGRGTATIVAAGALVFDVLAVTLGPYDVSFVSVEGQNLSNMTPPSLLLCGHMLVLCGLAVVLRPVIERIASNARVWWFVAVGNRGAMTLYLWHMVALGTVFAVSHLLGVDRTDRYQPGFWWIVAVQVLALWVLTGLLFFLLQGLENTPVRWWDDTPALMSSARAALVWVGLVVIVLTNLISILYGFLGPGVFLVPAFLLSLPLTRALVPTQKSVPTEKAVSIQEPGAPQA